RYRSPLQWMMRTPRRDVELHGGMIPAGALVLTMLGSANRDPRRFSNPNRFDITRDPNPHVAFGHGIHFCLGAPLARLEAEIAVTRLAERLPHIRLCGAEPEWHDSLILRGVKSLPVALE
ncbi:MAG: cytochrome P450, partial [Reyranella sp.]